MSAIASVRTVRASSGKDSQTVTKPVSPFQAALDNFSKCTFESLTSDDALRALDALVTATNATDADVASATQAVKDATEALKGFKAERAALVTRQRRAIRAALKAGFNGQTVAAHFSVSSGKVSAVKGALDLKAALLKGGMPKSEVPSDDALVSRVEAVSKVKGGRAALAAHARKTGTLPEDGDVQTFTVAQALSAVQKATDAVKHLTRTDGDVDTFNALLLALATLEGVKVG
jgi:hypothetical protein